MEITMISPFGYNLSRNEEVDQTKKSMAEGLSELLTVQKLWSTVVLVRFRNLLKTLSLIFCSYWSKFHFF